MVSKTTGYNKAQELKILPAIETNDKVFEKGICHPFQKSNNKLANYFLQKQC